MTPQEAIEVIAKHVITIRVQSGVEDDWENYPEIGEDDWERIIHRVGQLAPQFPDYPTEAVRLLAARSENQK